MYFYRDLMKFCSILLKSRKARKLGRVSRIGCLEAPTNPVWNRPGPFQLPLLSPISEICHTSMSSSKLVWLSTRETYGPTLRQTQRNGQRSLWAVSISSLSLSYGTCWAQNAYLLSSILAALGMSRTSTSSVSQHSQFQIASCSPLYLHKPSVPLQAPHRLDARGSSSCSSLSASFLSRDAPVLACLCWHTNLCTYTLD